MSSFNCEHCGKPILDTPRGYVTGCEHYPLSDKGHKYNIGDKVSVNMPDGWKDGIVVTVIPNYAWTGETKYSVHGKELVTIVSARNMKPVDSK